MTVPAKHRTEDSVPAAQPWHSQANLTGETKQPRRSRPWFYILPAVVIVGILLYTPFFYTVWLSVTDSRGGRDISFIGLGNYADFLGSASFLDSLLNTLLWVVGTSSLSASDWSSLSSPTTPAGRRYGGCRS